MRIMDSNGSVFDYPVAGPSGRTSAGPAVAKTVSPEMQGLLDAVARLREVINKKFEALESGSSGAASGGGFQPNGLHKSKVSEMAESARIVV